MPIGPIKPSVHRAEESKSVTVQAHPHIDNIVRQIEAEITKEKELEHAKAIIKINENDDEAIAMSAEDEAVDFFKGMEIVESILKGKKYSVNMKKSMGSVRFSDGYIAYCEFTIEIH